MNTRARLFVALTAVGGVGFILQAALQWYSTGTARFAVYLAVALCVSTLTGRVPGVSAAKWLSSLLVIVGIIELSYSETMLLVCAATVAQNLWESKRRLTPGDTLPGETLMEQCSVTALAVGVTHWSYFASGRLVLYNSALMLTIAAAAFFVTTNSIPVVLRRLMKQGEDSQQSAPDWYFWTFPYYLVGTATAGILELGNHEVMWQLGLLTLPVLYATHHSYRMYLNRLEQEKQQVENMAALHLRTIEALALAIDAKHQTTREHLKRMHAYSLEIGKALNIPKEELAALEAAALLHDVGNLAVPEHIMNKPGKLTAEEFEKIKIHPLVGAEILEQVGFPYPVVPIVRAHHEHWNGSGYPYGLKGEEIPIGARILSVVDSLHAMVSERPYKRALPVEQAVQYLVDNAGTEFDPRVVEVVQTRHLELEKFAGVENSGLDRPQTISLGSVASGPAVPASCQAIVPAAKASNAGFVASIASARQEAQMLWELTHDLGNSLRLDETLSLFSMRLRNLVPFDAIAIYVRRENQLLSEHASGDNFRVLSSLRIPIGEGLSGWVMQNRKPVINGNPALEPGYCDDPSSGVSLRSALSVPLDSSNDVVGVLTLYCAGTQAFTHDHLRILLAISSKLGLCIENALKFQQAESSAVTDYLTGLPNARSLFLHLEREVARCHRTQSTLGVMVCDLNGFKQVNDRFGHLEGNNILKQFANVLREVCRDYDYVARMGGDEFVIVAPGMKRDAAHERVLLLNRYVQEIGESVCGERLLSISAGSSFFLDDGTDAEHLLSEADRRMYIMKQIHHAQSDAVQVTSPS